MNFDPQKFFIGLMDFFSILLPGALISKWLMMGMEKGFGTVRKMRKSTAREWYKQREG